MFDLHENFGDRFGMYTNAAFLERGEEVYRAMIDAVVSQGFPIMPLADLMPYLNLSRGALIELYPGVYSANPDTRMPPDAFGVYAGEIGAVCFTTEMGLDRPLAYRAAGDGDRREGGSQGDRASMESGSRLMRSEGRRPNDDPPQALLGWYDRVKRDLPWRKTTDPYRILVSEVMLQQTQVKTVLDYYEAFLERFPDVYALAAASEDDVLAAWKGLGYYRRARNLHASAKWIVAGHGGRVPETLPSCASFKGIGDYTAAAVASIAFGEAKGRRRWQRAASHGPIFRHRTTDRRRQSEAHDPRGRRRDDSRDRPGISTKP